MKLEILAIILGMMDQSPVRAEHLQIRVEHLRARAEHLRAREEHLQVTVERLRAGVEHIQVINDNYNSRLLLPN